jgi:hypothetical protein
MAHLSWSINVQVSGGPTISAGVEGETVEATDRVEVSVKAGETKVVDLQPGEAKQIKLLVVKSSQYGKGLKFTVSDDDPEKTKDAVEVSLDGPQLFTKGSAGLFGVAPRKVTLINTVGTEPADVEIFGAMLDSGA